MDDLGLSYVKVDRIKISLRKIEDKPREMMKFRKNSNKRGWFEIM